MGRSKGCLWDPVVGSPEDQMMGRSRNVCRVSVKHVFQIQLPNTSTYFDRLLKTLQIMVVAKHSVNSIVVKKII